LPLNPAQKPLCFLFSEGFFFLIANTLGNNFQTSWPLIRRKEPDILVLFLFEECIPRGIVCVPDSTQLLIRAENTWLTPMWLIARIEKRL
jgi:hypothetical protein